MEDSTTPGIDATEKAVPAQSGGALFVILLVAAFGLLLYQKSLHGINHPSFVDRVRYNVSLAKYRLKSLFSLNFDSPDYDPAYDEILRWNSFNVKNFRKYSPLIQQIARTNKLDPNLVRAVIIVESGFEPLALSPKGAAGLMQLMSFTAKDLGVNDIFSPKDNIDGGTRYLRWLLNSFSGDLELALAAYNAGPGSVQQYKSIPPYPETQSYVRKVVRTYGELKRT